MTRTHVPHLLIGDAMPTRRIEVNSPYDGHAIASVDGMGAGAVDQALAAADAAYRNRDAWLPVSARIAVLSRTAELMSACAEELALQAAHEGGKPLRDSRAEVERAIDGVRNCAELPRGNAGIEVPMGITPASAQRLAFTSREPIGVVAAISAFNHPLNLIVHQVAPAVAAGCPVVIKPADETPLSCLHFIRLLRQAGLPDVWAQALVADSRATAERLASDARVAFLSFIGSARVGWHLRAQLAPGARCALEHGGAAPVIVDRSADLTHVIPSLAKGGFYHAGQVCVSVQRVFVHHDLADTLTEQLATFAEQMRVGDPADEATDIGPLIRVGEVQRVHQWVGEAVAAGAKLVVGGHAVSDTCYAPTVLFDPADEARVSREEIFGPVICIYPYDDIDQAIGRANALPLAFQAAVYGQDVDALLRAARRLRAATVMINDHSAFRVDWMPFAGLRRSGLGTGGIPYTYRDMQTEKLLVLHSPAL